MAYTVKTHAGTFWEAGRRYTMLLEPSLTPAQMIGRGQTIDHEPIPADALEFSVSGVVYYATKAGSIDRRYSEISGGQSVDDLRKVESPRARRMAELWERWHLNGMRANCAHMPDRDYTPGLTCPAGYTSGAAWLYEPIPADVLAELRAVFGLPA